MTVQELLDALSSFDPEEEVFLDHFEDGAIPVDRVERCRRFDLPDPDREAVFIVAPPSAPRPSTSTRLVFPRPMNHKKV